MAARHTNQPGPPELCSLSSQWWTLGLRGFLALAFGALALSMPGTEVKGLTVVFGAFCLLDGLCLGAAGLRRGHQPWAGLAVAGLLGMLTGATSLAVAWLASLEGLFFLWVLAPVWAMLTGLFELSAAFRLRREIGPEGFLTLAGAFSLGLGTWLLALRLTTPLNDLPAPGRMLGVHGVATGGLLVLLAFRLFNLAEPGPRMGTPVKAPPLKKGPD